MSNILITGGNGQLGRCFASIVDFSTNRYTILSHNELDICNYNSVASAILEHRADIVINCAAYTDVERAEEERELCYNINVTGVANLARACQEHQAKLIHISTDYVFGGDNERNTPYSEDEPTAPINIYGLSKREGEREALKCNNAIVLRTSWLYSPYCKNFCLTILHLASERDNIQVVDDQYGVPTSAMSLARNIVTIIDNGAADSMSGVYHLTDGETASWYDFACEIVQRSGKQCIVKPCKSSDRITRAKRPAYSVLCTEKISNIAGITIKPWREALEECLTEIKKVK